MKLKSIARTVNAVHWQKRSNQRFVPPWAIYWPPGRIRYWPLTLPCLNRLEMVENILIMTDVFSKYTQAIPTRDQRAPTVEFRLGFIPTKGEVLKRYSSSSYVSCTGFRKVGPHLTDRKEMGSVNVSTVHCTICCARCQWRRRGTGRCTSHNLSLPTTPPYTNQLVSRLTC